MQSNCVSRDRERPLTNYCHREEESMRAQTRYLVIALLSCGAALVGVPHVLSQEEVRRTTEVRRVSTVIGASVTLKDADRFGKVEDFIVNDNGCIDYLVVGY